MTRPPDKPDRSKWDLLFALLRNFESKGLYSTRFTAVQLRIVLYLLAQTRGTPREDASGANELSDFGRETVAIFSETIANALGVHVSTVWRELRRLETAGVVVVLDPGHKATKQVLCLNLDASTWRPLSTWDEEHPARALAEERRSAALAENPSSPAREKPVEDGAAAENPSSPARESLASRQGKSGDSLAARQGRLRDRDSSSFFERELVESSDPTTLLPQPSSDKPTICQRIGCGVPLPPPTPGSGRPRLYCSDRCQRAEEKRRRRERDRALARGESAAAAAAGFLPAKQPAETCKDCGGELPPKNGNGFAPQLCNSCRSARRSRPPADVPAAVGSFAAWADLKAKEASP